MSPDQISTMSETEQHTAFQAGFEVVISFPHLEKSLPRSRFHC